jgi:hypothetical protein
MERAKTSGSNNVRGMYVLLRKGIDLSGREARSTGVFAFVELPVG